VIATETIANVNLVPIRLRALYPPVRPTVDLFLDAVQTAQSVPYSRAAYPPSEPELDRLAERGVQVVYVSAEHALEIREQMRELVRSGAEWAPDRRIEAAREMLKDSMAQAWQNKETDGLVTQASQFGTAVVQSCCDREEFAAILATVMAHDGDTFSHITSVCVYSVMLARSMGINDEAQLVRIGQAALLHDIGKCAVSGDILRKPGRLTKAERELINDHPRQGFVQLCRRTDLDVGQLRMVYEHHERIDGGGYPAGLTGPEIHWMARLCSVVDVFDALTGRRAYRKRASHEEAGAYLRENAGTQFSSEFVECWIRNLPTTTSVS
jgi:HD-GYP domain-containing protein (c-di-GMP phosphodiesterase class II)